MTVTTSDKRWFDEFVAELRIRDVFGHAIGDAVASARELLADTGQSAEDTFGPARTYAASLELPRGSGHDWARRGLWSSLFGLLAFFLFVQAGTAWTLGELFLISVAQLVLGASALALLALMPLYLHAAVRHPWILGFLLVVGAGFGYLSSVVAPATSAEAWLTLNPLPWVLGSAVAMVLLSIWNTIRTLRRGNIDDITEPLPGPPSGRNRGRRAFVMLSQWFFPLFAAILSVVLLLTR